MSPQRVALVTGAARGIGRGIALRLAEQHRAVACADVLDDLAEETAELIRRAGGSAMAVHLDVTDRHSVRKAAEQINKDLGPIDLLVNNAGWDALMRFVDSDETMWDQVIDVNYKGCLRLTHAVLPTMLERSWGRIVNIGSDAGRVGSSNEAVYSGAKGAVAAFTKTIAREAARRGVTANTVCPGPTDTPLIREAMAAGEDGAKAVASLARAIPMGRLGRPEDVAGAVAYFTSDEAGFVTGQTLSVSGGLTMA